MKLTSTYFDTASISLSVLCVVHCLMLPLLLTALPNLAVLNLDSEALHLWLLYLVVPLSLLGLGLGCSAHKKIKFLIMGIVGVALLLFAATIEHHHTHGHTHHLSEANSFDDVSEKVLTLLGAAILVFAHYRNFRCCQHEKECGCAS